MENFYENYRMSFISLGGCDVIRRVQQCIGGVRMKTIFIIISRSNFWMLDPPFVLCLTGNV